MAKKSGGKWKYGEKKAEKKKPAKPAKKEKPAGKTLPETPGKPQKGGKPSKAVFVIAVAVIIVAVAAGLIIMLNLFQFGPPPAPGPDANVPEKEMPGDREEALAGARDAEPEGIEIIEGAESVPSELINPVESEETEKFEDLSDLLKVIFEITDKDEVTFEEISGLGEGRISITPAGDYSVQVLDAAGKILYELEFNAVFFIMGNPPEKIDSMKFVFVLPRKEGSASIAVTRERRILAEKEIS